MQTSFGSMEMAQRVKKDSTLMKVCVLIDWEILRKQLSGLYKREQTKAGGQEPFDALMMSPCLIGMEACGSAHYWARKLQQQGHTVRLMAPQFVEPYVKTNKNDAADAEAICEAVTRPTMRFVAIKDVEQQAVLALHRVGKD